MQPRLCERSAQVRSGESGAILLVVLLVLVALLAFVGLAVDSGNLYRARLALQNAADAAALATVNYAAITGKATLHADAGVLEIDTLEAKNDKLSTYLEPRAREVALANLARAGLPHIEHSDHEISFSGRYLSETPAPASRSAFSFEVTLSRRVDYLLMDLVPIIGSRFSILAASATSNRLIANVALLVDVSRSMDCDKGDPLCTCLTTKRDAAKCAASTAETKYDVASESLKEVLKFFDLEVDRISFVLFNTVAEDPMTLQEIAKKLPHGLNIDEIFDYIKGTYPPSGLTNLCHALIRAHDHMRNDVLAGRPNDGIAYFVLTDGAPTAAPLYFSDTAGLSKNTTKFADYDYTAYTIEWVDGTTYRPGPSLLFKTQFVPFGHNTPNPAVPLGQIANCNNFAGGAPLVDHDPGKSPTTSADAANTVFGSCVNSLASYLPQSTGKVFGAQYSLTAPDAKRPQLKPFGDWQEQFYNCAIMNADRLRGDKGTIYVAGYGSPPESYLPDDPYWDVTNSFSLKGGFLERVAWDKSKFQDKQDFGFDGYTKREDYKSDAVGIYQFTDDAEKFQEILKDMARAILLKLTV